MKSDFLGFFRSKPGIFILAAIICALILLLLGSFGSGGQKKEDEITVNISSVEYEKDIENRLREMISGISGTDDVKVMVTVDCGIEYVYAQNVEISGENEKREFYNGKNNEALLLKEVRPKVRGVAVVCGGGDNVSIQSKIIELVSNSLEVSSNRIFVGS